MSKTFQTSTYLGNDVGIGARMDPAKSDLAAALQYGAKASFEAARGAELIFDMEEGTDLVYEAGKFLQETEDASEIDGFRLVMGEVKFPSGHRFHAIIVVCVPDTCEHYGTYFLVPYSEDRRWLEQGTSDFDDWMQRARQADPSIYLDSGYRYRYLDKNFRAKDGHVGDDGWSLQ